MLFYLPDTIQVLLLRYVLQCSFQVPWLYLLPLTTDNFPYWKSCTWYVLPLQDREFSYACTDSCTTWLLVYYNCCYCFCFKILLLPILYVINFYVDYCSGQNLTPSKIAIRVPRLPTFRGTSELFWSPCHSRPPPDSLRFEASSSLKTSAPNQATPTIVYPRSPPTVTQSYNP